MNTQTARIFRIFYPIFLVLFSLQLNSCKKNNDEKFNKPPGDFTISITSVSTNSAVLNWTAAKDPENEEVTYDLELEDKKMAIEIKKMTYNLKNLEENKSYSGKIIAKDVHGNKTEKRFDFNTGLAPSPSEFSVKQDSISHTKISISWTPSSLPDGEKVMYDILLRDSLYIQDLDETFLTIEELQPDNLYKIEVIAKSKSGKSRSELVELKTNLNFAPATFKIENGLVGFAFAEFMIENPIDPEGDKLRWFVIRDGVEMEISLPSNRESIFSYDFRLVSGETTYEIAFKVVDEFGASTVSNSVSVTTKKKPDRADIKLRRFGEYVFIEWIETAPEDFALNDSWYSIDGARTFFSSARVTQKTLDNGSIFISARINGKQFKEAVPQVVQVSTSWGNRNYMGILAYPVNYTFIEYSPTTATTLNNYIKGPGQFPSQFFIFFKDCHVSDYPDWYVHEIYFDNVMIQASMGIPICTTEKPGYYIGNTTLSQYQYLKTKNTGYITIADEGGLHKINFTYTTED